MKPDILHLPAVEVAVMRANIQSLKEQEAAATAELAAVMREDRKARRELKELRLKEKLERERLKRQKQEDERRATAKRKAEADEERRRALSSNREVCAAVKYLHQTLISGHGCIGTIDPRQIITESDDDIRDRVERDPAWRSCETQAQRDQLFGVAAGVRDWLKAGRRLILLSPLAITALRESPEVAPDAFCSPRAPVEVYFEDTIPVRIGVKLEGDGDTGEVFGAILAPTLTGCRAVAGIRIGTEFVACAFMLEAPDVDKNDEATPFLRKVVRALADERIAWVEPLKRASTKARKAKRAGDNIGRLVLSDDALNVWRRRMLSERATSYEQKPSEDSSAVHRGPVTMHEVRPHLCRTWVLDPGEDEEVLDMRPGRAARPKDAADDWRASVLYCVSRPRSGCVRGSGEVKPRVERVVPCL